MRTQYFGLFLCLFLCGMASRQCVAQDLKSEEYSSYLAHIAAANSAMRLHEATDAKRWLKATPGSHDSWEWRYLNHVSDTSLLQFQSETWTPVRIEYSPDGEILAVACDDGFVRFFRSTDLTVLQELQVGTQAVYAARFSPDGNTIATCVRDGNIAVWKWATSEKVWEKKSGGQGLADVAFHPDGTRIGFCSWYRGPETVLGIVSLWDVSNGEQVWKTDFGVKPIVSIQFSPDGKKFAVGTWDAVVGVWDSASLEKPIELNFNDVANYSAIDDIRFDATGTRLLAATKNGAPRVWNLESGKIENDLRLHTNAVFSVGVATKTNQFLTGGSDGVIGIWDAAKQELIGKRFGHENRIASISVHPHGHRFATTSADKTIRVWSLDSNDSFSDPESSKYVYGTTVSNDGRLLATGGQSPTRITVWDNETRKAIRSLEGMEGSINFLDFGNDYRIVGGNWSNDVFIWDAMSGEKLLTLAKSDFGGTQQCAFSDDGRYVVVSGSKKLAVIWNAVTGEKLHEIPFSKGCWGVAFSQNSEQLAIGDGEGVIHLYKAGDWQHIKSLAGTNSLIYSVKFSPSGEQIAGASENGNLAILNLVTGEKQEIVAAHSQRIWTLDFSRSGERLATGSADLRVKIWDTNSGSNVLTISDYAEPIYNLVFLRDADDLIVNASRAQSVISVGKSSKSAE